VNGYRVERTILSHPDPPPIACALEFVPTSRLKLTPQKHAQKACSKIMHEINVLNEVIQTLNEVLGHAENRQIFTLETRLLGSIPEFDSMAVVTVLSELEAKFGLIFDDDELDGSIFENIESLVAFVSAKRLQ